jgi:hypothetical protein
MELDEFKSYWKANQEEETKQQKHTSETLNQIIMKTTNTLGELHKKNLYWKKVMDMAGSMLIGITAVNIILYLLLPQFFKSSRNSLPELAFLVLYAFISIRIFNEQAKIFDIDTTISLKDALSKAIEKFKRFYLLSNIVFLFLTPPVFYFSIKTLLGTFNFSQTTLIWITAAITVVSFALNHYYYKQKYFKKIKSLEENLKELSDN